MTAVLEAPVEQEQETDPEVIHLVCVQCQRPPSPPWTAVCGYVGDEEQVSDDDSRPACPMCKEFAPLHVSVMHPGARWDGQHARWR